MRANSSAPRPELTTISVPGCAAGEQASLEQRRVEAQDRVGALDVAADAHRLPVDADVRRDGRAAPRAAVAREALHLAPGREERGGEQVAGGLRALAAAPLFDGAAVARALAALPEGAVVFAGNSMPVRYVDAFDRPTTTARAIHGNRGASGIDGNVSTALGLAAATGRPVLALLGDITFYHDMNGLLAVRQHGLRDVTFLVTNNDGGGIFRRLPIARHDPPFTELFLTPHGLTFGHAAALYGLDYTAVTDVAALEAALSATGHAARLIEVISDGAADVDHHRAVLGAVAAALHSSAPAAAR